MTISDGCSWLVTQEELFSRLSTEGWVMIDKLSITVHISSGVSQVEKNKMMMEARGM